MSCKQNRHLPLFVGHDNSWLTSAFMRWHISRCDSCQAELRVLEKANEMVGAAMERSELSVQESDLWQPILNRLPNSESPRTRPPIRSKWGRSFLPRPAFLITGLAIAALAVIVGFWTKIGKQAENSLAQHEKRHPVIEKVDDPNVTVMTYLTDDPDIKIVWLFED